MNRGITIGAIAVLVALVAGGLWAWSGTMGKNPINYLSGGGNDQQGQKGQVYIAIKDAAASMGNVTAVDMEVDKIYLHSQSQGWVTVSQDEKTFKLLELKASGEAAIAAEADVMAGTYDQIWLHVSSVKVTENGKVKEAILPSADVKMDAYLKVEAGAESVATVDVIASDSLHKTAKGEVVFTPVIVLESRSNTEAQVDASGIMEIAGGTVDVNMSMGMDVDGQVKNNFKLEAAADLEINAGQVTIKAGSIINP